MQYLVAQCSRVLHPTEEDMNQLNIHQRLNAVMREVTYVQKDREVTGGGQNYKAVTHDKVVSVCRASLVKNGVSIEVSQTAGTILIQRDPSREIKMHLYAGEYDVSFVNVDKPDDRVTVHIHAHANDNGDKAPGKCITYATKSAILKLLMLETGEDDESRAGAPGIDTDPILLEIDSIKDLDKLRSKRKEWADMCAKAKDTEAWSTIKAATERRAAEINKEAGQ